MFISFLSILKLDVHFISIHSKTQLYLFQLNKKVVNEVINEDEELEGAVLFDHVLVVKLKQGEFSFLCSQNPNSISA